MKRHGFRNVLLLVFAVAAMGVLSIGVGMARADTSSYHGQVAGLISDGSVYVTSPTDYFWHLIDPVTFAKDGYTTNDIKWYGAEGLPGSIAPDTVVSPAYESFVELIRPAVNLAGLLGTGGVYIAQADALFHPVTPAQFVSSGYKWNWVKWFGQLPGSIAP